MSSMAAGPRSYSRAKRAANSKACSLKTESRARVNGGGRERSASSPNGGNDMRGTGGLSSAPATCMVLAIRVIGNYILGMSHLA